MCSGIGYGKSFISPEIKLGIHSINCPGRDKLLRFEPFIQVSHNFLFALVNSEVHFRAPHLRYLFLR